MKYLLEKCKICPHKCGINRIENEKGRCRASGNIKVALASLHYYEEPCISGKNGSGTIFFSNCNLSCKYCQNYKISQDGFGKEITTKRLAEIMINLQEKKANNINLVTPTIYVPLIIESIKIAKQIPDADILVTHDRPFIKKNFGDAHDGLKGITEYIYSNHISLHIHGHLHEESEEKLKNGTISIGIYKARLLEL